MDIKIQVKGDGSVYVAAIDETAGAPEHRKAATLNPGQEIDLNIPDDLSADQVGFGDIVDSEGGDVVTKTPGGDEGQTPADKPGGGNEGSPQNTKPPAPEAGGGEGGGPTSAEGEGGGAPAEGGAPSGEPASTSAASEKPLYLIDGGLDESATSQFEPSGLETPDGKTLYHYSGDTAGQGATGNRDGVSVYADADDNEKPVQPATPSETGEEAATA